MKMKSLLLLLSALIALPAAAPALAGEAASGSVVIVLKGPAKGVQTLAAVLEKDAAYNAAACSAKSMKKPQKSARITCAKADGALLAFLAGNAPAGVHWSISAATAKGHAKPAMKSMAAPASTLSCPSGCYGATCGGVGVCVKNKPAPLCTPC